MIFLVPSSEMSERKNSRPYKYLNTEKLRPNLIYLKCNVYNFNIVEKFILLFIVIFIEFINSLE